MPHFKNIAIVLLIVGITFFNSLFNGFVGDDETVIVGNKFYHSLNNLPRLFNRSYTTQPSEILKGNAQDLGSGSVAYRPVLSLTYFIDYALYQLKPFGYHLTNFILHLINSLLVYYLSWIFLNNLNISLLSSLFWGVHPLRTEAVCSIGYRADLLAMMFLMLAFIFYINYRDRNKTFYLLMSGTSLFLALFSKESAVMFVALIFCYDVFCRRESWDLFRLLKRYSLYLVLMAVYLYVYIFVFPNSSLNAQLMMGGNLFKHLGNTLIILSQYLSFFLFPLSVKTLPPQYHPAFDASWNYQLMLAVSVLALVIFLTVRLIKNKNRESFFILWFLLMLLPVANIFSYSNPMAHRFMYLPSVGLSMLLAWFMIEKLPLLNLFRQNKDLIKILILSFLVMSIVTTAILNIAWKNSKVMAFAMLHDYPDDPTGYLHTAEVLLMAGESQKAKELLLKGVSIGLNDYRTFYYLGWSSMFDLKESEIYYREGIKRVSDFIPLYNGLGRSLTLQKKYQEALPVLTKAVAEAPTYSSVGYLIQLYRLLDQEKKAQEVLNYAYSKIENPSQKNSLIKLFTVSKENLPVDLGM